MLACRSLRRKLQRRAVGLPWYWRLDPLSARLNFSARASDGELWRQQQRSSRFEYRPLGAETSQQPLLTTPPHTEGSLPGLVGRHGAMRVHTRKIMPIVRNYSRVAQSFRLLIS